MFTVPYCHGFIYYTVSSIVCLNFDEAWFKISVKNEMFQYTCLQKKTADETQFQQFQYNQVYEIYISRILRIFHFYSYIFSTLIRKSYKNKIFKAFSYV